MDLIDFVSITALVLTYMSFLSGARVCWLIHKSKSSGHLSPIPFLAGLICTALWLNYGIVADEWAMITVNSVGIICQLVYIAFFTTYSRTKKRIVKQFLITSASLAILIIFILTSDDPKFFAGSLASMSSFIACASPLATIQDVIKSRNVSSLPFPIIFSSFIVSLSWLTLGYLIKDHFIFLSNAVTTAISAAQLSLFAIYPSKRPYEKLTQSNKKSLDLIKLLKSGEEDVDLAYDDDEVDSSQDYKVVLTALMGQIYAKTERLSRKQSAVMILLAMV